MTDSIPSTYADPVAAPLLEALRVLIVQARQQVLRHVDDVQVQTYWHIGRHIVEFEQGGQARAAYGKRLLPQLGWFCRRSLAKDLTLRICGTCGDFFWPFQNATHCVAN